MQTKICEVEAGRSQAPKRAVQGQAEPKYWPVKRPSKATKFAVKGDSGASILRRRTPRGQSGIVLNLGNVIVDEWGADHVPVKQHHPTCADYCKPQAGV